MKDCFERRCLQIFIAIGGCVPVLAGGAGMVFGTHVFSNAPDPLFDSHVRYLSGLLFGIGIGFWSCIPAIETKGARMKIFTLIVVLGGLARLYGAAVADPLSPATIFALGMELAVTPALYLWQRRVSVKSF